MFAFASNSHNEESYAGSIIIRKFSNIWNTFLVMFSNKMLVS